ncbi:TIGR03086 family metal-binding protein [Longispora albida]|uniref:TIGR03086 family metal-binding protein n=1 Tax=Longispora albida TaxID=203523 RepID=UPI0003605190|nr:TIGR03086 family metal-binding protein [Longispora albida]
MDLSDLREADRRAVEATDDIVGLVTAGHLANATPCAGWDLADLLRHMTGQHRGFAAAARGQAVDVRVWEDVDLGADPVRVYQESAAGVLAAFAEADLSRRWALHEFGNVPGSLAVSMHFVDYLVHGWDVARAIGASEELDDELSELALRLGSHWPAGSQQIWGPGAPFGHQVTVPADAPPGQRLLGFLGREP